MDTVERNVDRVQVHDVCYLRGIPPRARRSLYHVPQEIVIMLAKNDILSVARYKKSAFSSFQCLVPTNRQSWRALWPCPPGSHEANGRYHGSFDTPGTCFSAWFQPPLISRRPSILIRKHVRLSLPPPHREIQHTAAVLSPRTSIEFPMASTLSRTISSTTRVVTTMPNNSNRSSVILQVSRRSSFSLAPRSFLLASRIVKIPTSTTPPPRLPQN